MSPYRRSPPVPPVRTGVCPDDLQQLDVVRRVLALLNEPTASADELGRLIDAMPVLAARLAERFSARTGNHACASSSELAFLGNRELEAVLFQLLEDLTDLSAEQAGVPAHGSMFPTLVSVRPPRSDDG